MVILIVVTILVISLFYFKKTRKKVETETEDSFTKETETETILKTDPLKTVKVEEKAIVETVEEINTRLQNIVNPDKDKPFAKISAPDLSEIPEETKLKRTYKKRAPKPSEPI